MARLVPQDSSPTLLQALVPPPTWLFKRSGPSTSLISTAHSKAFLTAYVTRTTSLKPSRASEASRIPSTPHVEPSSFSTLSSSLPRTSLVVPPTKATSPRFVTTTGGSIQPPVALGLL